MDAFGRLRTSDLFSTFEYYPSLKTPDNGLDEDTWVTTTTGTGNCSYNSSNYLALACTSGAGTITRQTKQKMFYQPGKSRLFYFSGVMNDTAYNSTGNVTTNLGIFSLSGSTIVEGIYLQSNNGTFNICSSLSSTPTTISQNSWNIDPFDGTGPSGLTLNSTNIGKDILLVIDQEWLGVGRVRVGFNISGINYYAHQFLHDNISVPYSKTPRLPISYQIVTDSSSNQTYTMRQICCCCMMEGGFIPMGTKNSISTNYDGINMTTAGTKYILLALRINSSYPVGTVIIDDVNCVFPNIGTGGIGTFELQLHSTNGSIGSINGTLSFSNVPKSIAQYAKGDLTQTINTDGYILNTFFAQNVSSLDFNGSDFQELYTRNAITQYDTMYLVGYSNTSTTVAAGALNFIEII